MFEHGIPPNLMVNHLQPPKLDTGCYIPVKYPFNHHFCWSNDVKRVSLPLTSLTPTKSPQSSLRNPMRSGAGSGELLWPRGTAGGAVPGDGAGAQSLLLPWQLLCPARCRSAAEKWGKFAKKNWVWLARRAEGMFHPFFSIEPP